MKDQTFQIIVAKVTFVNKFMNNFKNTLHSFTGTDA